MNSREGKSVPSPRQLSTERRRMPMLAGWLFADLFLVLFMVGLASLPPNVLAAHTGAPPAPAAAKRAPRMLDLMPVPITVSVPPTEISNQATRPQAITSLIQGLNEQLAAQHLQGRQAGFVLVFASAPESGIGQAIDTAKSVIEIIRSRDATFAQASGEGLWSGAGNYFHFQIFFFV
jgi:hypothetical protein